MGCLTVYRMRQHNKQEVRIKRLESLIPKPMEYKQALHFSKGREGNVPQYVIIHWTDGTAEGSASWFQNPKSTGSAHYIVEDTKIIQCVNESDTAWGATNWFINLRAINIEVSADPKRPASDSSYITVANLVHDVCIRYGIPMNRSRIKGHKEVSSKPTACPGTVSVDRVVSNTNDVKYINVGSRNYSPFATSPHFAPQITIVPSTLATKSMLMGAELIQFKNKPAVFAVKGNFAVEFGSPEELAEAYPDPNNRVIQILPENGRFRQLDQIN